MVKEMDNLRTHEDVESALVSACIFWVIGRHTLKQNQLLLIYR